MFSLRDRGRASTGWIEFELVELLEASVILELGLLGGREKSTKIQQTQLFTLGVLLMVCRMHMLLLQFHTSIVLLHFGYVAGHDILSFPLLILFSIDMTLTLY